MIVANKISRAQKTITMSPLSRLVTIVTFIVVTVVTVTKMINRILNVAHQLNFSGNLPVYSYC